MTQLERHKGKGLYRFWGAKTIDGSTREKKDKFFKPREDVNAHNAILDFNIPLEA